MSRKCNSSNLRRMFELPVAPPTPDQLPPILFYQFLWHSVLSFPQLSPVPCCHYTLRVNPSPTGLMIGCIPNYCPSANCPLTRRKKDPLNRHQPIAYNLENPQNPVNPDSDNVHPISGTDPYDRVCARHGEIPLGTRASLTPHSSRTGASRIIGPSRSSLSPDAKTIR